MNSTDKLEVGVEQTFVSDTYLKRKLEQREKTAIMLFRQATYKKLVALHELVILPNRNGNDITFDDAEFYVDCSPGAQPIHDAIKTIENTFLPTDSK